MNPCRISLCSTRLPKGKKVCGAIHAVLLPTRLLPKDNPGQKKKTKTKKKNGN